VAEKLDPTSSITPFSPQRRPPSGPTLLSPHESGYRADADVAFKGVNPADYAPLLSRAGARRSTSATTAMMVERLN